MLISKFKSADEAIAFLINQRIATLCAAIMVAGVAMVALWYWTAYENAEKYRAADIVATGRLHEFRMAGTHYETCTAVHRDDVDEMAIRDMTPPERIVARDFCPRLLVHARDWQTYQITSKESFGENLFYTVFLLVVVGYGWTSLAVAGGMILSLVIGSLRAGVVLASVLLLPFVAGMAIFLWAAWQPRVSSWDTSEGTVATTPIFIGRDGHVYRAPKHLFDWSDDDTMKDLSDYIGVGRQAPLPGKW